VQATHLCHQICTYRCICWHSRLRFDLLFKLTGVKM